MALVITTVAEIKEYIGNNIPNSADKVLGVLLAGVTKAVEKHLGFILEGQSYTQQLNGTGNDCLFTPNRPINSVSSLQINGIAVSASSGFTSTGYGISDSADYVFMRGGVFTRGKKNIFITYNAGWSTANFPADLKNVVIETVALRYKERDWTGFKSKSLAGETTTFETNNFSKNAMAVLNDYRKVAPI